MKQGSASRARVLARRQRLDESDERAKGLALTIADTDSEIRQLKAYRRTQVGLFLRAAGDADWDMISVGQTVEVVE